MISSSFAELFNGAEHSNQKMSFVYFDKAVRTFHVPREWHWAYGQRETTKVSIFYASLPQANKTLHNFYFSFRCYCERVCKKFTCRMYRLMFISCAAEC